MCYHFKSHLLQNKFYIYYLLWIVNIFVITVSVVRRFVVYTDCNQIKLSLTQKTANLTSALIFKFTLIN